MREANKAVKRERHISIDELILDLNGAKMFSKLDLRSGNLQYALRDLQILASQFRDIIRLWNRQTSDSEQTWS